MTIALGKTRDMQGNPLKKPRFIKKQADDDNGDKSKGGIPDNIPHHRNIIHTNHPCHECQHRPDGRCPTNA